MRRREVIKAGGAAVLLAACGATEARGAQDPGCFMPGETIDRNVFFLDANMKPVRLLDAVKPGSKAVVLVVIGGAYLAAPDRHGGIWCEDTLYDFGTLKAAVGAGSGKGVQFICAACPPVYSEKYGWPNGVFLDEPDDSPKYVEAVRQFIGKTEALRKDGTIPFDTVYYDPRFRLLWNPKEYTAKPAYGTVYAWQGKFKWHKDTQRYGTPCIWFLDPHGKVLREPLYGNNYASEPPRILYTYWELEGAIQESLAPPQ